MQVTHMRMIKLTGWFVLLLTSLPLHAQTHGHICASIGQSDVEVGTCGAQVRLYEDNYQRDLNAAARLASDPQLLMTESVQALSQQVTQCLNFECIRIAYLDETQRLQTIERNAIDNAMTWMPPAASDHTNPDVNSPDTTTTQSTWAEEVPALQQPEAINADPLTAAETSSSISAPTQQSGQTGVGAKSSSSGAHVPSTGETHKRSFVDQLATLSLWAVLGCILLLLLLAATDHVVVFYDGLDVMWSFVPLLSLVIGYTIARSISSVDSGTSFLEILVMGVAILIAAASVLLNYRNAIRHNRNMILGLAIGTLKMAAATFTVVSVAGQLSRLSDSESTRRKRADAMFILAVNGFVWWALVNGPRVYKKRGWQLVPTT